MYAILIRMNDIVITTQCMNSFPAGEETYVEQGKDGKAKTQSRNTL
jgi:hypothetical protein